MSRRSSADGGATWSSGIVTSTQKEATGFDLCAGPDDQAYLLWHDASDNDLSVARYINYFTSVGGFQYPNNITDLYYDVYIASARYNSYPTNYVAVVYQDGLNNNSATRSWEIVSSDGGQSFSAPSHFLVGDNHAIHPFVACTRCGTSDQFVGYVTQKWSGADSVMAGYKYSQSASWNNLGYKNDHRATGETTAQGSYILTGLGGGMYLIYREYANDNIWYDRASYASSIEEISLPVIEVHAGFNQMMFTLNFPSQTMGKLMIFDLTGRIVKTLYQGKFNQGENSFCWDYLNDDISSGTYIMLLNTPINNYSQKFSILN
ncbi:T9SS type A sorting domain-containing protein [candidate division WOR-3 bacterium]|nr:T9SS type A sorting domain-containing protein [candidate division WOR-3 bacterium]